MTTDHQYEWGDAEEPDQICLFDVDPKFDDYNCPYLEDKKTFGKSCKEVGCPLYYENPPSMVEQYRMGKMFDDIQAFKKELVRNLQNCPDDLIKDFVVKMVCKALFALEDPPFLKQEGPDISKKPKRETESKTELSKLQISRFNIRFKDLLPDVQEALKAFLDACKDVRSDSLSDNYIITQVTAFTEEEDLPFN